MAPGLPQPPELRCRAEAGFKGTLHPNTCMQGFTSTPFIQAFTGVKGLSGA